MYILSIPINPYGLRIYNYSYNTCLFTPILMPVYYNLL